MNRKTVIRALLVLLTAFGVATPVTAQVCGPQLDGRLANAYYQGSTIFWDPVVSYDRMVLTISGPCEEIVRVYDSKEQILFDIRDVERIVDGNYSWELRRVAPVDKGVQQTLVEARGSGEEDDLWWSYFQNGKLPDGPFVESGAFSVVNGSVIDPASGSEKVAESGAPHSLFGGLASAGTGTAGSGSAGGGSEIDQKVVFHGGSGSITGSLCVGFDCPASPSFGDSTVILSENNLRIKFADTSINSFPSGDWEIEANSNANGGQSYLAFNDCGPNDLQGDCATDLVFGVESGARQRALWVEADGDVGFGTANPVVNLHVIDGNTPTLRLEQDASSGFAPQSWDVAGNETSFFVRDASNGSTLPFRIFPASDSNLLNLNDDKVGVGDTTPETRLHVQGGSGDTKLLVEETSGTANGRQMMELRNNGNVNFVLVNTAGDDWQMIADTGGANPGFSLSLQGSGVREFRVAPNGDIIAGGAVVHASSRTLKENFVELDPRQVLTQVTQLPITRWNYTKDGETLRHVGPMAEDFYAAFGLGSSDRHIAVSDSIGVTMAALQGLNEALEQSNQEQAREIGELRDSNAELLTRVEELEALMRQIAAER